MASVQLFHATSGTRTRLLVAGGASAVGFFFCLTSYPVAAGVLLTTMLACGGVWIFSGPSRGCSFCQRYAEDVEHLTVGELSAICDECLAHGAQELNEKDPRAFTMQTLRMMPSRLPRAVSTPIFAASPTDTEASRDAVVIAALRLEDDETVIRVTEPVPPASRSVHDWVHLSAAYECVGRFDDALEAITHFIDNDFDRPWGLNNRASTLLARGGLDKAKLNDVVGDMLRTIQLCAAMVDPPRPDLVSNAHATLAEARRQLGDLVAAKSELALSTLNSDEPWRLVIEARVALDGGLRSEAERLLDLALEKHHPESVRRQRTLALKQELLERP